MAYSYQEVVSDGTLVLLPISIEYIDKSDLSVFYDDREPSPTDPTWSWVPGQDAIQFSPAVPNGVLVRVQRESDASRIRHVFSALVGGGGNAQFNNRTMDQNFQQFLLLAQEYTDKWETLTVDIRDVSELAQEALETSQDALDVTTSFDGRLDGAESRLVRSGLPLARYTHFWNEVTESGFIRSNPTGQAPEGGPINAGHMALQHIEGTGGRAWQMAWRATGNPVQRWVRFRSASNVWSEWELLPGRQDITTLEADIATVATQSEETTTTVRRSGMPIARYTHFWNDVTESGFIRSNPTGQPPNGGPLAVGHLAMRHLEGTDGRAWQTAFRASGSPIQSWTRFRSASGVWGEWVAQVFADEAKPLSAANPGDTYNDAGKLMVRRPESQFYRMAFNDIYTSAAALNQHYYDLATEFSNYVTAAVLGQDDFGNDIVEFTFAAPTLRTTSHTSADLYHPKIVIISGTHGSERAAAVSTLAFADDLCRNWQRDERLAQLRWGATVVIVACLNPSGVNAGNTRRNGNNVDIGRNMSYKWDEITDQYKGPSALSEKESQIAASLPGRHPTACAFIDFHGHENNYLSWFGCTESDSFAIAKHVARTHSAWFMRQMFSTVLNSNPRYVATTGAANGGIPKEFEMVHNRRAFLLEAAISFSGVSAANIRRIAVDALTTLTYENWRRESETRGLAS